MTTRERVAYAIQIAKQGQVSQARSILLLAEGHLPGDEMNRVWAKFGKIWRGEV